MTRGELLCVSSARAPGTLPRVQYSDRIIRTGQIGTMAAMFGHKIFVQQPATLLF